jgi:hypothetical protein
MLKRFNQAWKRDRLGVLGVGAAVVAFGLWAFPIRVYCGYVIGTLFGVGDGRHNFCDEIPYWETAAINGNLRIFPLGSIDGLADGVGGEISTTFFTSERLPAIAAFLAIAFILLLLRRR